MAKIMVCDICKKDGKLTECSRYISYRGRPMWRLDYCDGCKGKIPKKNVDYVKFIYSLKGITLTDEEANAKIKEF